MRIPLLGALLSAFVSLSVHANPVTHIVLADVIDSDTNGSAAGAADGLGQDGFAGAFNFIPVNLDTYAGAKLFSGDVNQGMFSPWSAGYPFTSGFKIGTDDFVPYLAGSFQADITAGALTFYQFDWAVNTASQGDGDLPMAPDPGTLVIDNFIRMPRDVSVLIGEGDIRQYPVYAFRMHWSHLITYDDDMSGDFTGLRGYWALEGLMASLPVEGSLDGYMAAIPEPETYAMLLAGLGLIGLRRRRMTA